MKSLAKRICVCLLGIFLFYGSPAFAVNSLKTDAIQHKNVNRKTKAGITLNGSWKGTFLSTKENITYVLNMSLTNSASGSTKKFKGVFDEATEDNGDIIVLRTGSVEGTISGKTFKFILIADPPCSGTFKGVFTVTKTVKGDVILGKEMKGSYSGTDCGGYFKGKGKINWSW